MSKEAENEKLSKNLGKKLGKTVVGELEPADKDYISWDTDIYGFGVKVTPAGGKVFIYQYRNQHGKTRRLTIGRLGKVTADQARKRAEGYRAEVNKGGDPAQEKQEDRKAETVGQILELYLQSDKFAGKADITQKYDRARVERHLMPLLGNVIAKKLTRGNVQTAFRHIKEGRTANDEKLGFRARSIVKGGEGAARGAIRLLRSALSWAVDDEKLLAENPAKGVNIGRDGRRRAILDGFQQYEALFRTLDAMEQQQRIRRPVADVIRLIALTGARKSEIAAMRWGYVDLKRGLIRIPPDAHKTGNATGEEREIALPAAARAIIAAQPKGKASDLVFPSTTGGVMSLNKIWRQIRAEAGLPDDIGLHGLRHSYATTMAMQGAQAADIMAALGHKQISTSMGYVEYVENIRVELAERHAAGIAGALTGAAGASVTPIDKAGKGAK